MECTQRQYVKVWHENSEYYDMLTLVASLSKLFSENDTPYLDYRVAENLFCKYFQAQNDARSCTAYDARIEGLGIGIKTFGVNNGHSVEKIAEFNKLKPQLDPLEGYDLAYQIGTFRNERMDLADRTYNVNESIYHIVGRKKASLTVFNTPYNRVNLDNLAEIKDTPTSISFTDGREQYTFNKSKSVLMKRFFVPQNIVDVPVNILSDPLEVLEQLLKDRPKNEVILPKQIYKPKVKGYDYVILPLYSTRGKIIHVPEKSGLNQWNAGGRQRDENEIYIPVPSYLRTKFPDFFPERYIDFELQLPDGQKLSAKICQDGGKALMSKHNADLGKWLLRQVLGKKPGELVTMEDLVRFGIDSVYIEKLHSKTLDGMEQFKISFTRSDYESYQEFWNEDD